MSITFWVPEAPRARKRVPCDYGKGEAWACAPGQRCGYCRDGWDEVWEGPAPELNVANETARAMLAAIGLPCDEDGLYGALERKALPLARRAIVRALNASLAAHTRQAFRVEGRGSARVIDAGIDEDRIRDRLRRLDAVLAWAQAHDLRVAWG